LLFLPLASCIMSIRTIDEQTWRALLPKRKTPPGLSLGDFAVLAGKKKVLISRSRCDHPDSESIRRLPPETRVYVPLGLKAMMNER
jgi:hypothetical protein